MAYKFTESERVAAAERWIASAAWGLVSLRADQAQGPQNPSMTLRVFAKGFPAGAVREVHQLFATKYRVADDPVVGGEVMPGRWYQKLSLWGKDSQSTGNGDSTVTFIREFSNSSTFELNCTEDGCGTRTWVRAVFDALAVEDVGSVRHPVTGLPLGQGFEVRIGGVSRSPEGGALSYYVTVSEQKTKVEEENTVSSDAFAATTSEEWTGLRGTPANPVTDAGTDPGVPVPGAQDPGLLVEVAWSLNQANCTQSARVSRRRAKPDVESGNSASRDLYTLESRAEVSAASDPLPEPPEPDDGVTYTHSNRLRPDLLTDTSRGRQEEREVPAAEVASSETLYTRQTRTTGRALRGDPPEASAGGGKVRSVQYSQTPGRRKNVTVSETEELRVDGARVARSLNAFGSETSTASKGQDAAPEPSFGDGKAVSVSFDRSEGGLKDVQVSEKEDFYFPGAEVSAGATAFEDTLRVSDLAVPREVADAMPGPSAADGVTVQVTKQETPGGRVNVTTGRTSELDVGEAAKSVARTAFGYTEESESVGPLAEVDAAAAGGGVTETVSASLTPGRKHRRRVSRSVETPFRNASVSFTRSAFGTRTEESDRSVSQARSLAPGELGTVASQVTPGLLRNTSKTVATAAVGAVTGGSKATDVLYDQESQSVIADKPGLDEAGILPDGRLVSVSYQVDPDTGACHRSVETKTPRETREYVLTDIVTEGFYRLSTGASMPTVLEHIKAVLFYNVEFAVAQKAARDFLTMHNNQTLVWYKQSISFSLSPNLSGLWSGTLTMEARAEETMQITIPVS